MNPEQNVHHIISYNTLRRLSIDGANPNIEVENNSRVSQTSIQFYYFVNYSSILLFPLSK